MKLIGSSIFFAVATAITVLVVNNQSSNTYIGNTSESSVVTGPKSYILQGATPEKLNQIVTSVGGNVSREFPIINAVSAMLTPNQAEEIRENAGVRVQDDRTVVTSNTGQSVPDYTKKWNVDNHIAKQVGADRLHHKGITGRGVTVAVIDSGSNMWGSVGRYLFTDQNRRQRVSIKYDAVKGQPTNSYNDDENGHGTHVSNIIASSLRAENGAFNGIAPNVYLLSVKAFDKNGESSYSKVLDALNWIFENRYEHKIRVVNMSLGAEARSHYWQDPINQAVMRLWQAGVVVVASAGNNGEEMGITVPGNNPYVITVGAVTDSGTHYDVTDDRITSFSAKGPTIEGFIKPEVVTYGANISTKLDQRFLHKKLKNSIYGRDYTDISGTSQAAALVSGVAALVISNDPYATPDEVKCRIISTASVARNGDKLTYSPFSQGAGLVNAYAAAMSTATNCGNNSLNIEEDLLGINHFMGPARMNEDGEFYIELADGRTFTQGMHWAEGAMGLNGMHWAEGAMGLNGMHWAEGAMGLNGMHWAEGAMDLQGMHWAEGAMGLNGMHWAEGAMGLNGMHWAEGSMDLDSADLQVEPIDPTIQVPISSVGWQ